MLKPYDNDLKVVVTRYMLKVTTVFGTVILNVLFQSYLYVSIISISNILQNYCREKLYFYGFKHIYF